MLLEFYPPDGGEILLGDRKLSQYSIREWHKRCGIVILRIRCYALEFTNIFFL
ncbi:MAG: hypothetical protein LUF85_13830 [Bacteroides sp.]|nr:hypothetical protein [Bacteroides sp.]